MADAAGRDAGDPQLASTQTAGPPQGNPAVQEMCLPGNPAIFRLKIRGFPSYPHE